ncbi:MAG TPA: hypothetical protein P5233_05755 [Candidatus Paceibacterota bacterium]|nr:hypothetical protein [Candidatus Paceibacterota bacterium]
MTVPELILTYVVVLLGGVGAAAILSEMRRRRFTAPTPEDRIFRCEQCGYVYTDDADMVRSRCSQCGTINEAIEF